MQRQLRIQGEPHPLGIHTVESGVADKKFCRILQAGRAVSGAVVLKHPVNAFQHPVPVQQGSRQNQIRLGFKIPEHRTLGKPGQPGNVCNLCFLDSVFKKTVQGLFRNQPDVFLPLFLVRQVMLPPMYLSVELTDIAYTGNKDKSSPGYVHFTFSFAVLQDAISITRKDVHFAERVLYERSSMYFVLWSIHHIFKCHNYTVKSIARSLSNHKILPCQFCAVCRFFSHHSGVTWFKSTHC